MRSDGWILDAYIEDEYAYVWFKTVEGKAVPLKERYHPDFYLIPRVDEELDDLSQLVATHPSVVSTSTQRRYVSIDSMKKERVLCVMVDRVDKLKTAIRDVENLRRHKAIGNLDLPHVQRYLMGRDLPPTLRVRVEYDSSNRLKGHQVSGDEWELKPPLFTTLMFEVEDSGDAVNPEDASKEIEGIEIFSEDLKHGEKLTGDETDILNGFQEKVSTSDVDLLISRGVSVTRLLSRAKQVKPNLQFGRLKPEHSMLEGSIPRSVRGRVWIDVEDYTRMGLAGLTERCRFTYAPPRLCSSWQAGKIIDARQCYEALKSGIIIPTAPSFYKHVLTVKELAYRDRGGLILSPQIGLHENVGELDFESMFPNIIVKENISYETVTPARVDVDRRGFLSRMTEEVLKRRLYFKHLKKRFEEDRVEHRWCEQRNQVLKMVLVCIYGYSGCFANRFNNVSAYEEINRRAREILVRTLNIALEDGYRLIYADTDSIFVKREDALKEDYRSLASRIGRETGLSIALDHHYRFLVLLPQGADPEIEAARRYFGRLVDGGLHCRGIELRRHDTPEFLKVFQERLMKILFDSDDSAGIAGMQVDKAREYVFEVYDRMMRGEVSIEELVVNKVLRKPLNEYSSILPHVAAAIQARQHGAPIRKGETISFIHTSSENPNPLRRVLNVKLLDGEHRFYDREKYADLLLDVAETILGVFGFNASRLRRGSEHSTLTEGPGQSTI